MLPSHHLVTFLDAVDKRPWSSQTHWRQVQSARFDHYSYFSMVAKKVTRLSAGDTTFLFRVQIATNASLQYPLLAVAAEEVHWLSC